MSPPPHPACGKHPYTKVVSCRWPVCSLTERLFVIVVRACFLFGTTAHDSKQALCAKGKRTGSKEPALYFPRLRGQRRSPHPGSRPL
eukprot:scaffold141304_cov567-Phaeocystis_antarctica.AAC.1